MSPKAQVRIPKGMRDILPVQMIKRQYVIDVIKKVFETFGFEPLQTPAIEMSETLRGKYGEDAERLIYNTYYSNTAKDDLSLRYDLSVPLCRVVAIHPNLTKPFKRYQIAPVWRADRPQKGRYREFYQCDADTVGSASMLADAEIIHVIYEILTRLGFNNFVTYINHRKVLQGIGQFAGVPDRLLGSLYRSIDKIDKIGLDGVERELKAVGLPRDIQAALVRATRLLLQEKLANEDFEANLIEQGVSKQIAQAIKPKIVETIEQTNRSAMKPANIQNVAVRLVGQQIDTLRMIYESDERIEMIPTSVITKLLALLQISGPNRQVLADLGHTLGDVSVAVEGIFELEEMIRYFENLGIPEQFMVINFSMVRGLEYYTGPIFETIVKEPNIGSITGGGRYDKLIGMFTKRSQPATGTSFGIERIIDVMEEMNMFPPEVNSTVSQVLVSRFDDSTVDESLKLANTLRQAGLNVELYFGSESLKQQLKYANTKSIPLVLIAGPDEIAAGQVTLKQMNTGEQKQVDRDAAATVIKDWLS